jgi:hypothetical protein
MSDKTTHVNAGGHWLMLWGYVSYDEAVEQLREHYQREHDAAEAALAAVAAGDVRVFQQRGVHVARDRREVTP